MDNNHLCYAQWIRPQCFLLIDVSSRCVLMDHRICCSSLSFLCGLQVIEEVDDDDDEEEEEGGDAEEEDGEEEGELVPEVSSDDGEISPVKLQRGGATNQSKKFASLSALESRPTRTDEV